MPQDCDRFYCIVSTGVLMGSSVAPLGWRKALLPLVPLLFRLRSFGVGNSHALEGPHSYAQTFVALQPLEQGRG